MNTTHRRFSISVSFLLLASHALFAQDFESWIVAQRVTAMKGLLANIEPHDAVAGIIIASPSREGSEPNYYFDWVRDSAITMMEIVKLYEVEANSEKKAKYLDLIQRYAKSARERQTTHNRSGAADKHGLGEPKWRIDNSPFHDDWGRPQNDGPALRSRTLIYFAEVLLREGKRDLVLELYNTNSPAQTVIKVDLEFIEKHWQEPSYELWEEVKGLHFSTLVQQRRALASGARLAEKLHDHEAALRFTMQKIAIGKRLKKFWDKKRRHFVQTHDRVDGLDYKHSNLDASIILSLLDKDDDPILKLHDQRVLKTAEDLRAAMREEYSVNQTHQFDTDGKRMGDAIGRYVEDRYDGISIYTLGNPWFLITAAFAELNYNVALAFIDEGRITITDYNIGFLRYAAQDAPIHVATGEVIEKSDENFYQMISALLQTGDAYLRRWRFHADIDGSASEQLNRHTGFMQGAKNLTWNYAAFLSAHRERSKLKALLLKTAK